ALPGGPMYVNRGMIEAARNEGEIAGVMAHELSHVALRHGTAQVTQQNSFGNRFKTIGLILGGAMAGGEAGAQMGAVGAVAMLHIAQNHPIKITPDFERIQAKFRAMPRARTMAQIERDAQSGRGQQQQNWPSRGNSRTSTTQTSTRGSSSSKYSANVDYPATN